MYFPLGLNTGGVTFDCTDVLSGNVHCATEYTFDYFSGDDPGAAGFDSLTAQWNNIGCVATNSGTSGSLAVWFWYRYFVGFWDAT